MTSLQHPNREVHREVINYSSIPPKAFARYFANYFILKHHSSINTKKNSFERLSSKYVIYSLYCLGNLNLVEKILEIATRWWIWQLIYTSE